MARASRKRHQSSGTPEHAHARTAPITLLPSLFQSFWMGGFESACYTTRAGTRLDMLAATQHDRFIVEDFFWPDVHSHVAHYVAASTAAGHPWVVTGDEMGGANFGTLPDADDPDHDDPRRFGLWGSLMAGGAGVEWYFGWQNNSRFSDLSAEDWRPREAMYRQTRLALDFFQEHLPFHRMRPADDLVVGSGVWCLAAEGEIYAIYLPNGGGTRFDLGATPGLYEIRWFNPRVGGPMRPGTIARVRGPGLAWTGWPPDETSRDWLAVVRRVEEAAPAMTFADGDWPAGDLMDLGLVPAGFDHALNYWRMQVGRDGLDTVAVARRGVIVKAGARAGEAVSTALSGAPLVADALATLAARAHWSAVPGDGALSALDLLRVGHVVLNDGQWAGRRVVSAADLDAAMHTSPIESNAAVDPTPTWFTNARRADGSRSWPDAPPGTRVLFDAHHGVCIVVPEWDMVIARVGTDGPPLGGHTQVLNSLLRRLGMAVSPLASAP